NGRGVPMTFDQAGCCIKKGDVVALRRALDSGLDPNLANRFSWSLLMLSAIEGNAGIAELLVSRARSWIRPTISANRSVYCRTGPCGVRSLAARPWRVNGMSPSR